MIAAVKIFVKRIIIRSLFLVVMASAIGLIVNAVRTPNVDLFGYKPPKQKILEKAKAQAKRQEATITVIGLAKALALQKGGRALFVDARKPSEFASGHIAGAINIPAEDFEAAYATHKASLNGAGDIIAYCSDIECDEAFELAESLRLELGRTIFVFSGGMREYGDKGPVSR
ncbi:rhodanese-like domain-containing protein [bacterium]|nr:rhodanese-like domain-containing protein [bacterium]